MPSLTTRENPLSVGESYAPCGWVSVVMRGRAANTSSDA